MWRDVTCSDFHQNFTECFYPWYCSMIYTKVMSCGIRDWPIWQVRNVRKHFCPRHYVLRNNLFERNKKIRRLHCFLPFLNYILQISQKKILRYRAPFERYEKVFKSISKYFHWKISLLQTKIEYAKDTSAQLLKMVSFWSGRILLHGNIKVT